VNSKAEAAAAAASASAPSKVTEAELARRREEKSLRLEREAEAAKKHAAWVAEEEEEYERGSPRRRTARRAEAAAHGLQQELACGARPQTALLLRRPLRQSSIPAGAGHAREVCGVSESEVVVGVRAKPGHGALLCSKFTVEREKVKIEMQPFAPVLLFEQDPSPASAPQPSSRRPAGPPRDRPPPPPLVRSRFLLCRPDAFEERGDVFLHPLSPPKGKCIARCMVCWRRERTCIVASARLLPRAVGVGLS